ncbi:MAG: metallophosphoesterase [Planctomycetota bacterium]
MKVIQLSDPHLGPRDHDDGLRRAANRRAWDHAEHVADALRARPDTDELVIVVTGDLTDEGHVNPSELPPAAGWLASLPGAVYAVPGNHDVGNFVSSTATPTVSERYLAQWQNAVGPDRFAYAADGHRLIGLNSMLIGSGLPPEAEQADWLHGQLDAADAAGESVWVFQHAPLFLRAADEVR